MKALNAIVTLAILMMGAGAATAQNAPPVSTRKVDGTENVYVFRYGGHQSMFIVTSQGVIATDPISYLRPAKPYIDAIKAVTDKPIKYVIYSHHHYDHIAGGQPFKDLGATFIAHRRAKERLLELKKQNALLADVVIPDQVVDGKKAIKLGDTTLELIFVGRNHSDNSLVMQLPKEKLVFVVDFAPIETIQFRNIPDNASPLEYIDSLKKLAALDWDRMIPGHPLCRRTLRHQKGCRGRHRLHGGFVGGGEKGGRRGQVFRHGDEGGQAAEI
jgi:glyoxylase-like metal-dependent hydrolase (beta-lactamase superfamily II)